MNPVSNLTTSFILLAIGLTILWLAATNRLSNFITAWGDISKPGQPAGGAGVTTPDVAGQAGADLGAQVGGWIKNQAGQWIQQQIGAGVPGTMPVQPGTSPSPTSFSLEAGGGTSYRLAQLPSLGTITTH